MRFITYLINGISLGSIYAIIALGYTMVYGIAKMLNFAHGDVIMIGRIYDNERHEHEPAFERNPCSCSLHCAWRDN